MLRQKQFNVSTSTTFTAVMRELECGFVRCLKLTQCHIFLDGKLYLSYCTVTVGELDYRIAAPVFDCR